MKQKLFVMILIILFVLGSSLTVISHPSVLFAEGEGGGTGGPKIIIPLEGSNIESNDPL